MDNKDKEKESQISTYRQGSWLYVAYNRSKEKDTASTTTWQVQVQRFK